MRLNDEIKTILSDTRKCYDDKLESLQKLVSKPEALILLGQNPQDKITLREPLGGLKPLYLVIEKKYFDEIIAGTKTEEFRFLSESTMSRYTYIGEDGRRYLKPYDRIRLCVGYHKNRDEAMVEVIGIECDGDIATFKLGRILEHKKNNDNYKPLE